MALYCSLPMSLYIFACNQLCNVGIYVMIINRLNEVWILIDIRSEIIQVFIWCYAKIQSDIKDDIYLKYVCALSICFNCQHGNKK